MVLLTSLCVDQSIQGEEELAAAAAAAAAEEKRRIEELKGDMLGYGG